MTTASGVPCTYGELEGDEALETLRRTGRRRLVEDAVIRFRAADGFSHSRALAFQTTLTLLPALIAVVGLAAALDQDGFTRVVRDTIQSLAPGAAGDILTDALRQGSTAAGRESGETALIGGALAASVAGTTAMAQVERGANRIYGVERDRPFAAKYLRALLLALTAGILAMLSLILLVGGAAIRDSVSWSETIDTVWQIARWPLGLIFSVASVALLFEYSPRRRQPEASWLAVGAGVAAALWLVFVGVLYLFLETTDSFGATYGPIAGTIGVLLWTFLTSVALFLGLAFSAQLEAVRAGVPGPRVDRLADLWAEQLAPQAGDLGHGRADVDAAPSGDLLLEVDHVGRDPGQRRGAGEGALELEIAQVAAGFECGGHRLARLEARPRGPAGRDSSGSGAAAPGASRLHWPWSRAARAQGRSRLLSRPRPWPACPDLWAARPRARRPWPAGSPGRVNQRWRSRRPRVPPRPEVRPRERRCWCGDGRVGERMRSWTLFYGPAIPR